ncbi:hypothetical protein Tco_0633892 [Tanacetum coccineum]
MALDPVKEDGSRTGKKEDSKALVTIDGEGVDWTSHSEEDEDYALMACNSLESDTKTQPSESETQTSEFETCESNISAEPSELVSELVVSESNVECQPKGTAINAISELYWRPQRHNWHNVSKYNDYPHRALQNKGIVDSGMLPGTILKTRPIYAEYQSFLLVYPGCFVRSENQANKHAGPQEANHNVGTQDIIDAGDSEKEDESAQDCFVLRIWSSYSSTINPDLKTDEKPVDKEDQVFLDELERLKRQEKDANDAAKALRKEFAQETENLLIQVGATKASSTNIVNTVSTPAKASSSNIVNTVSTPVSTASPYDGLSLSDPTNPEQDDSKIPALEDIYQNPTDGIFTNSSYDDEGAVADFTNLETVVNVSPIPTSRINSFHPLALILGDPNLAVQTRSKVTKSSGAHAFVSYVQKQRRNNHKDFPALRVAAVQDSESWILVDLPYGKSYWNKMASIVIKMDGEEVPSFNIAKLMKESVLVLGFQVHFQSPSHLSANQENCRPMWLLSTTKAEKLLQQAVVGKFCVLWIQNQMLDYGFNFMNTKIYIDNESTICIVKNPVYHSKTKHIAIRHHFIRDAYEKKLIQVLKIHTDDNVADLLTKAFDVSRGLIEVRESLRRVTDGTDALLIPTLFILWLDKVSTDSANLVPLGKVCTAIETLKKNTAKGTNSLRNLSQIHSSLQALISLLTTITLSTTMAVLDSCPKHNMVAYLEKSEGNAEFHEIIDFLKRSSIHHALTVSPVVSTTFVEQFWTSAKSKIINNVRHITAKVAGKSVSISEASIRSDLLFDDADGIDSLPNQAIFDAIQLMGYEGDLTVLTFNKAFEVPIEQQNDPSPRPSPSTIIPDSIPEASGGNIGGHSSSDKSLSGNEGELTLQSVYDLCLSLCAQVSDQAKEIQHLKAQIKKLKKQAKPVIKHHRAWMQSISLKQRLARKRSSKKQWVHKESVSKQGRKFAKGESSVQGNPLFDEIPEDTVDHMETENAQDVGRTRVCLYIRSMSSTSWIVQDIRHKLGRFNFFIKISGLLLISRIRTRFSSRGYEEKKVMDIDFEDNLFGLYGDEDLTNLAKCLIIENEDFVKEIAVCLYIRSMSSTSWIVQDIRHKLGRFNFFIKILIVHIFNHLRGSVHKLHIYTRPLFDDDKKGKNIDTEDLRLVEPW